MPRKDVPSFVNRGKNKNHRSKIGTWGKHPDFSNKSRKCKRQTSFKLWNNLTFSVSFVCSVHEFRLMDEGALGSEV